MANLYQISRHVWLCPYLERNSATNLYTGRRVLLDPSEITLLEQFREPAPVDEENTFHQRLLSADIIQVVDDGRVPTPKMESLEKALDKYLAERNNSTRRKIRTEFPSLRTRLEKMKEHLLEELQQKTTGKEGAVAQKDLSVVCDHVETFLSLEVESEEHTFCFSKNFLEATSGRPLPREDYEQQPCLPETTERRLQTASSYVTPDTKALILGDDDLLSLAWPLFFNNSCDVFELDEELISYLQARLNRKVTLRARDLTQGLPGEIHGSYDLIFTDPMYEETGMDLFLRCCEQGLSSSPEARVMLTTRPDMLEGEEPWEMRVEKVGLKIEERLVNFSRYRLPDFYRRKLMKGFHQAGLSPQMIHGLSQIPYLYADLFILKR